MSDANPYQSPEVGERGASLKPDAISSSRYAVNMGCGIGALLVWVPVTVFAIYQFAMHPSAGGALALGLYVLFLLGCFHSVAWVVKRRGAGAGS